MFRQVDIAEDFNLSKRIVVHHGNCLNLLKNIPDDSIQLIVTSPPYNLGKEYETKLVLDKYVEQ